MRCLFVASVLAVASFVPAASAQSSQLFPGGGSTLLYDFSNYTRTFPSDYRMALAYEFSPAQGDAEFFVAELRYRWRFDGVFSDSDGAPIVQIASVEPLLRLDFTVDGVSFQPETPSQPAPSIFAESMTSADEPNISRFDDTIVDNKRVYRYIVPAEYAQNSQRIEFVLNSEQNFDLSVANGLEADYGNFWIATFEPELTWVPYEGVTCPGDVNADGSVDLADLNLVLANFGQTTPDGDADNSGGVDLADLNIVLGAFGTICE